MSKVVAASLILMPIKLRTTHASRGEKHLYCDTKKDFWTVKNGRLLRLLESDVLEEVDGEIDGFDVSQLSIIGGLF